MRLGEILDRHGGQAVWPYWGTGTLGYLQGLGGYPGRRFFNVIGASHHDPTICSIAGSTGLKTPSARRPAWIRRTSAGRS